MRINGKGFIDVCIVEDISKESFIKQFKEIVRQKNIVDYKFFVTNTANVDYPSRYCAIIFLGEQY